MNKILFVAIACVAVLAVAAAADYDEEMIVEAFTKFKHQQGRRYLDPVEEETRYQIFRVNYARALDLNKEHGVEAFGITPFSDKTPGELQHLLNYKRNPNRPVGPENDPKPIRGLPLVKGIPEAFDWRDQKAVTPVRDQGQCGSCWAFSAVEQVESAMLIAFGNSTSSSSWLSTQQVVDCDKGRGDYGCNGGDLPTAYAYMIDAGGLEAESTYPYKATDRSCVFNPKRTAIAVKGWSWAIPTCEHSDCAKQDEAKLAQTMKVKGPTAICVAASNDWFSYTGPGPYKGSCKNGYFDLNHCVQMVGLAQTSDTTGYWIVRNSWGTGWGHNGYIYLPYGSNKCGLADEVAFVDVALPKKF